MPSTQELEDDIPVTQGILALAEMLRKAAAFYRCESSLAKAAGLPEPVDFYRRCETLFFSTYADAAKGLGLSLNQITFEALLSAHMPDELLHTFYDELPTLWVFNPYRGWRKV